jgi:hypothetical protein
MTEQQTIVCVFEQSSTRVLAYDIHEWVYETLRLHENEVVMIQIDGTRQHVYIKYRDPQKMQAILTATQGQEDFRHDSGEISKIRFEAVGLGMRRVRVVNLPPEMTDKTFKNGAGCVWRNTRYSS